MRNEDVCAAVVFRYLFTERNDSEFGNRVAAVHSLFETKLEAMPHGEIVWGFLKRQNEMVAQLSRLW